jgi:hypothetical protein
MRHLSEMPTFRQHYSPIGKWMIWRLLVQAPTSELSTILELDLALHCAVTHE